MGCSFSGMNAIYDAVNGGGDVWINDNRFRIIRQLGGGDFAYVYMVNDVTPEGSGKTLKDPSHISAPGEMEESSGMSGNATESAFPMGLVGADNVICRSRNIEGITDNGVYAMKKALIPSVEQLELVRQEIQVSSLFCHPNLLPLLDHAIISVKGPQEGTWNHEAYLLFPLHLDGTLLDNVKTMKTKKELFPTVTVLQILQQLCAGLKHMHGFDPPYAHNDIRPGNVLLTHWKGEAPLATLMDFGSAAPARREIRFQSQASQLQEWAAQHCSAPYRAPELWECPSYADIDERTDIWSLGCTLYAMMYGESPFEWSLGESGETLKEAVRDGKIHWPSGSNPPYPEQLHQFVVWMLQPNPAIRPWIDDVVIHVDKLLAKFSS